MKKIIALFAFLIAFTFNVNAQDRSNSAALAKQDVSEIAEYLQVTNAEALADLQTVFKEKHEALSNAGGSEERKIVIARFVEAKLDMIFNPEEIQKLKLDTALYKKLTQE